MTSYRLKGTDSLAAKNRAKRVKRDANAVRLFDGTLVRPGLDPAFKGNAKAALRVAFADSTLGASTRQGWRMAVTADERREHGSSVTRNTAEYVAYNGPNSSTGTANPLTCTTAEKAYKASPSIVQGDKVKVPFETRADHIGLNCRMPGGVASVTSLDPAAIAPRPVPTRQTIENLEKLNDDRGADETPYNIATATDFVWSGCTELPEA